ncbi:MAG TPA: aminoglycoside adenylyltransferase domain-containing protein [Ktedonobacteraceae bacterium]|jgi:predicted nucleotidyltransferase
MDARIPDSIQPLIDAYLRGLEPLCSHFYGIYVYGSIALGAFEELESDIDIIALTQGEWSPHELEQLKALHIRLIKEYPLGRRLEVFYPPSCSLGVTRSDVHSGAVDPYPVMRDGIFEPAARGGLNVVAWWIIKHHGLCLLGPEPCELSLKVTWDDILADMRFNLNVYFARKVRRRPYVYLADVAVEFAVTNLCRIFTTIEEGEIVSKSESLDRWRNRLPERWRLLLDEARRIRHHLGPPSLYRHRLQRWWEMLAFIQYGRERGNSALDKNEK